MRTWRGWLLDGVLILMILLTAATLAVYFAGAVAAQTTVEPIYNSTPTVVDNTTWMEGRENVSLDNVSSYAASLPSILIGTGEANPGDPLPGALITGLLLFMSIVLMVGPSRVGIVAGVVIAVLASATLVEMALAPQWMLAIVAMAVAILVGAVWLRVVR